MCGLRSSGADDGHFTSDAETIRAVGVMTVDKDKGEDNPFSRALREERDLELEVDRLSWQQMLLISRKYKAQAAGDSALAAELDSQILEVMDRQRELYRKWPVAEEASDERCRPVPED